MFVFHCSFAHICVVDCGSMIGPLLRHFHFTVTARSFMKAVAKRACSQVLDDPLLKTSGTLQKAGVRIQRCRVRLHVSVVVCSQVHTLRIQKVGTGCVYGDGVYRINDFAHEEDNVTIYDADPLLN